MTKLEEERTLRLARWYYKKLTARHGGILRRAGVPTKRPPNTPKRDGKKG